ncbi:MAG: toll/interleukin-1 receptor domain-containing protein, partial [Oscillospiraceae bacterium]|nr:toll/interleukin-1 receptor domain-containing protein [Oscillospiraceae bacterium]
MYQPKMDTYEGSENYIFISYAHRDAEKVWPILDALNDRGYRVWYDDGIDAGSEWPAYIEDHLNRCAAVVSFISPNAVASANCRREITYALSQNKPFVYVMLEETELAQGMSLQLSGQYCINRGALSEEKFLKKLCGSDALAP